MGSEHRAPQGRRVTIFDTVRGFTIVSMVAFHASYDAAYLYHLAMPWFTTGVFQDVWRASISWAFLLLAGWMTQFSRNNIKRAALYGAAALVVYIATAVASVDTAVSFGILFCMAASTLIYVFVEPVLRRVDPRLAAVACLVLFALTYAVPKTRYGVEGLAWLGFPSPSFTSGDYYPILPFAFMYLAGASIGRWAHAALPEGFPAWCYRDWVPPLTVIGRFSLPIYLIHQPLILLIFMLVFGF